MKLSELASAHNLEPDLLLEVVQIDLKIKGITSLASELKEADVAKILACDGLETVDGKPFTPVISAQIEEKTKKKQQAKKGLETRKRKQEEEEAVRRQAEEARVGEERRKHAEELARREADAAAKAAAEAQRAALEAEIRARHEDTARQRAEEEMAKREAEAKRIAAQFAALRGSAQGDAAAEPAPAGAPADAVAAAPAIEAEPAPAPAEPQARAESAAAAGAAASVEAPASADAPVTLIPTTLFRKPEAKAEPAAKPAPVAIVPPKAVAGLGSKLATLAKQTHEKADHSIKAVPKPVEPSATPQQELSAEDRRKLIQQNIAKNLAMAKKVAEAKAAARTKGFRTIDRSKTPGGPGRGPGGPNRGGPGRGRRPDSKDPLDKEDREARAARRLRSTLDEDVSGVTEFAIAVPCTVREFSEACGVKSSVIIAKLLVAGMMANMNSVLDKAAVELLAGEFKKTVTIKQPEDLDAQLDSEQEAEIVDEDPTQLSPRPPVVTIMGHVDHGKTSLLDAIRKTQVAAGEAGGITQHIGAYTVTAPNGLDVTFIDTPGHEAFTEMRARGSKVTDVAVIVVAADDGVQPQTVEAINHAKAANVPLVVALNKIDKPDTDVDKVMRQLAEAGVQVEDFGGDIGMIRTSAVSGVGITELLERLALETEVQDLKANHGASASGTVIEASRSDESGITVTLLVQRGSLFVGDVVIAGTGYGKVRSLTNWRGERVDLAGPSHAVVVGGLDEVPRAGDRFQVVDDLRLAGDLAEERRAKLRERQLAARQKVTTTASLFGDLAHAKKKELKLVVKADAAGSLEVLTKTINDLATEEVRVSVIHSGVGAITASDVTLAEASKATVIGFHVIADSKARSQADQLSVDVRSYTIIYEMLDELRAAMGGMLDPETRETVIGQADVRQTFVITKVGVVAGLYLTKGTVRRDAFMRITRENRITHTGKVGSLRRFKEDVKEVREGYECGLTVEGFQDIRVGDMMEFYVKEKVARKL